MSDQARAPESLVFSGDLASTWKLWRQKFDLYLIASGKSSKPDLVKIAILLNLLGDEAIKIYNTFEYEEGEDKEKLAVILSKFEAHCNPTKNLVYEHFKFFKREQLTGETIDQFITALRQLASTCDFKEKDVLIRDRIVLGVQDARIQEKLLQYPNLGLNEAIDISRAMEASVATLKEISKDTVTVSEIRRYNRASGYRSAEDSGRPGTRGLTFQRQFGSAPDSRASTPTTQGQYRGSGSSGMQTRINCKYCGQQHERGKCPAFNRFCSQCNQKGHYRRCCPQNKNKNVFEVHEEAKEFSDLDNFGEFDCSEQNSDYIVWTITSLDVNAIEWFENIFVSNIKIKIKIDSGSMVNTLNLTDFSALNISRKNLLKPSGLSSYSGHKIGVMGQIYLDCVFKNKTGKFLFHVLDSREPCSILGLSTCQSLGILPERLGKNADIVMAVKNNINPQSTVQGIVNQYSTVFQGIGKVCKEFSICLSENAIPSISAPRKVPLALRDKIKAKIDDMVTEKILEPVTQPTDWVHPIVVVPKPNDDIRICMDPRNLNKFVKREIFEIPTQDILFSQLSGAKYFSLLDASSAFLQLPLTYESSLFCTIATPFGRYRYLRLPYGISSAPELFQRCIYEILEGVPGQVAYFDDILVYGKSIEEHNRHLETVLQKIKNSGLTLSQNKSQFCVNKIKFLGHIISEKGITPDEKKTLAIRDMKSPKCKKDLQRFLGMITYLSKFIPNLSSKTNILRQLLSGKNEWQWSSNEQNCFDNLKELVSNTTTLSYFDPSKEITLSVDAGPCGLGAFISQDNQPIEFASVSLTPTQQRYNHIEKELLAVVFGCERFNFYVYGQKCFKIESDHRPLIGLLKKPLDEMSPRIQRLVLRLLKYRFILEYVPGKKMQVPDTLSRDPTKDTINTDYLHSNIQVFSIIVTREDNRQRLQEATNMDEVLRKIKYFVLNGWPKHKSSAPNEVKKYWDIRNDIFLHNDILFYNKRIIIPEELKQEFLNLMHDGHQGVVACKMKAKEAIYYPGWTVDLENIVLSCNICQSYAKSNQKEPLMPHEIPNLPWQKVGIDFKSLGANDFLVVVDYFSKFVVVNKLTNKTAETVISTLKNIFSANGIPQEIFSDCGPPFTSFEFRKFASTYDITLSTSSPHYPRSNGMIERAIQNVKSLLTKCLEGRGDPFLAVLNYNTTPKQNLPAPCDLLMGRRLRTTLPVHENLLKPKFSIEGVKEKMKLIQNEQKKYHDVHSKKLTELQPNQPVFVYEKLRQWRPGVVTSRSGPNDYDVEIGGAQYRRNRHHLRPIRNSLPKETIVKDWGSEDDFLNLPQQIERKQDSRVITRSGRVVRAPQRFLH